MSRNFDITLSAKDKFTAAFNKLEKTAGRTNRALGAGEKTLQASNKTTDSWAKGLAQVARGAEASVSALSQASPLAALAGMSFTGLGGALAAIGVGAGLLTQKWAEQTTSMARTATAADISAETMQVWSAAAKAAGFSGDMMARSLVAVSTAMYDINQQLPKGDHARMLFQVLGIDPTKKIESVFPELLTKMREKYRNPITRGNAAEFAGMDREIALLIEKMPDLQAAIQKQTVLGAAQSAGAVAQAEAQVVALGNLENAWKRVFNATAAAMSPTVVKVLDAVTGRIASSEHETLTGRETQQAKRFLFGGESWRDVYGRGGGGSWGVGGGGGSWEDPGAANGAQSRIQYGSKEFSDMLVSDMKGETQFSSPDVKNRIVSAGAPIQVEIAFSNAPAGTTASARQGDQQVPVRISHSMPTGRTP